MNEPNTTPNHEEVAAAARHIWEEEGEPDGKAEEHWQRAEEMLRQRQQTESQPQN